MIYLKILFIALMLGFSVCVCKFTQVSARSCEGKPGRAIHWIAWGLIALFGFLTAIAALAMWWVR